MAFQTMLWLTQVLQGFQPVHPSRVKRAMLPVLLVCKT